MTLQRRAPKYITNNMTANNILKNTVRKLVQKTLKTNINTDWEQNQNNLK